MSRRPSIRPLPSSALLIAAPLAAAATTGVVRLSRALRGLATSMGAGPGRIATSAAGSDQYRRGVFHNRISTTVMDPGQAGSMVSAALHRGDIGKPAGEVPLTAPAFPAKAADLAVTWLGHAGALIELDGHWVLADPIWGERASPSETVGPRRLHRPPMPLAELPHLDAVVISHDHYDHLDLPTIRELVTRQTAPFVVPLGVGAHLRGWGVPESRIIELDWDERVSLGELTLTCTEARHFSGRGLKRNTTLWSSWAMTGPRHRVYFGGDTGYTPAFAEIGARLGPFDLTLMPIGAYGHQWPDIHLNPEQAWRAHGDLGGDILLPIHWATFDLAFHAWVEPVLRLLAAAAGGDQPPRIVIPRPGARLDLLDGVVPDPHGDPWWLALARPPARTAASSQERDNAPAGPVRERG